MKREYEIRNNKNYEIRAKVEEGKKVIECTIPYNSISEDMGFLEVLKPGCFSRSIKNGTDIRALYQHNTEKVIGRIKNETLVLEDTPTALKATIVLPQTQDGDDVYNLVNDGYITNCSFGFRSIKEEYDSKSVRNILEAHLIEISPVTFPAYEMTSVNASLRSLYSEYNIDADKLGQALEQKNKEAIKEILEPLYNTISINEEDKKPLNDTFYQIELMEKELELMKMKE